MKSFFEKIRKASLRPNLTTFVDIIVIVLLFVLFSSYFKMTRPQNNELTKDKIKYKLSTSDYTIKRDNGILIINFLIENRSKKNKILEINQRQILNVIIEKNEEIYFKKDILERKLYKTRMINLSSFEKIYLSYEWYINSNNDKEITPGKYNLIAQIRDMGIELTLPIEIE